MTNTSPLRLWTLLSRQRRRVAVATAWSLVNTFFDFLPEILIGLAVDTVIHPRTSFLASIGIAGAWHQILLVATIACTTWALESASQYLYMIGWRDVAQNLQHDLRCQLTRHVLSLRVKVFEARSTAELSTVVNDDVNQLERFMNDGIHSILSLTTGSLLVFAVYAVFSPMTALIAIAPVPLIVALSVVYRRRIDDRFVKVRRLAGAIGDALSNGLRGFLTIRAFDRHEWEISRVARQSEAYRQESIAAARLSAGYVPALRLIIVTGFAGVMLYGGHLCIDGKLPVAAYSTLVFLTQRLLWPMASLAGLVENYQKMRSSLTRIGDVLSLERVDAHHNVVAAAGPIGKSSVTVSLKDVSFGYRDNQALWRLNMDIPQGQRIAVVGRSGTGKSTLLKLLLGFYEPSGGLVRLSKDGTTRAPAQARDVLSYVSQEPYLFSGSIAENIRYGSPAATDAEIEEVCSALDLHEFIAALPDAYATQVGEGGGLLSGGQRQRLAIGRALLRRSNVLLLDEHTSALDVESTRHVEAAVRRFARGRTVVVVTHRLEDQRGFDHVIDFDEATSTAPLAA